MKVSWHILVGVSVLIPLSTANDLVSQEGANPYAGTVDTDVDGYDPISLPLDIKPDSCPNQLNVRSKGVFPVALLGSAAADVSEVDLSSLRLSRADGRDARVAPLQGPPGPSMVIEDVAAPAASDNCECSTSAVDGILDLSLRFSTPELVETLALTELETGDSIELMLSGVLTDDTPFVASDCVSIIGGIGPGIASAAIVALAPTSQCALQLTGNLALAIEQAFGYELYHLPRLVLGEQALAEAELLRFRFQRFHVGLELRSERFLNESLRTGSRPPA